ncbi:MAG: hypothetical protein ACRDY5_01770 [Acidimicrobiales bacterium]
MYGTWARQRMTTSASQSAQHFVASTMWFKPACNVNAWVEEGLAEGWDSDIGLQAYEAYWAYRTIGGVYNDSAMAFMGPDPTITDEFQISRSPYVNVWNVYWNGTLRTTPNVGFWSGDCPQMGGEIVSNDGHADTFDMYSRTVNGAGQFVFWNNQSPFFSSQAVGQLNGISYQNSQWSWNTVN